MTDRLDVVRAMTLYADGQIRLGVPVGRISRHLLGLFQGLPGARAWRRFISEHAHLEQTPDRLFTQALGQMGVSPVPQRCAA
jgi:tRNA-dihydrouridine synthase A